MSGLPQPPEDFFHQLRVCQPLDGADRHRGAGAPPDGDGGKAQGGRAEVAAQQGSVDADVFDQGVLGPLDGVLHLRRRRGAVDRRLDLEGRGAAAGEEQQAEAAQELLRRGGEILHGFATAL